MELSHVEYAHPCLHDGAEVYRLVTCCPPLDVNSQYYYHIFCRDFQKTCVLATYEQVLLGFVSSFLKPDDQQCLFIWQVAVLKEARRKNIASTMLRWLLQQPACQEVKRLEATFSARNHASRRLFTRFAQTCGANSEITPFLASSQFHDPEHEEELLLRLLFSP